MNWMWGMSIGILFIGNCIINNKQKKILDDRRVLAPDLIYMHNICLYGVGFSLLLQHPILLIVSICMDSFQCFQGFLQLMM